MTHTNGTKPSWLEPHASYHTNASTLAAQLHEIADALGALGDQPLSEVSLSVSIQASQHGPHRDRVATVDLLAQALIGTPPIAQMCATGDVHYGPDYAHVHVVNVFANVVSAAEFEEGQILAESACGRCRQPFTATDNRVGWGARHGDSPWCKGCVDRCHESTDFAHECVICEPAVTR